VSLCGSFPTLFDLVDNSKSMEVDGVDKKDYWKVVDRVTCVTCVT
jgi:glycerol-3-phosphate dehydrogenase subunit C